jgi:hypothetical protein
LEVMMQKGELLQAWASQDPARYDDCIAHWTETRLRLARVRPRPQEYYQVVFNAALALLDKFDLDHDSTKLRQAEQLLKSTLALDASLDGAETVRKYRSLLVRAQSKLPAGRSPR